MYVGNVNYFALIYFTIHIGSNCHINTGVRDLEVALFKAACFPAICKFLGDFGRFLGRVSFSQRISKIWRNRKY